MLRGNKARCARAVEWTERSRFALLPAGQAAVGRAHLPVQSSTAVCLHTPPITAAPPPCSPCWASRSGLGPPSSPATRVPPWPSANRTPASTLHSTAARLPAQPSRSSHPPAWRRGWRRRRKPFVLVSLADCKAVGGRLASAYGAHPPAGNFVVRGGAAGLLCW